jgi:hypothetical protein
MPDVPSLPKEPFPERGRLTNRTDRTTRSKSDDPVRRRAKSLPPDYKMSPFEGKIQPPTQEVSPESDSGSQHPLKAGSSSDTLSFSPPLEETTTILERWSRQERKRKQDNGRRAQSLSPDHRIRDFPRKSDPEESIIYEQHRWSPQEREQMKQYREMFEGSSDDARRIRQMLADSYGFREELPCQETPLPDLESSLRSLDQSLLAVFQQFARSSRSHQVSLNEFEKHIYTHHERRSQIGRFLRTMGALVRQPSSIERDKKLEFCAASFSEAWFNFPGYALATHSLHCLLEDARRGKNIYSPAIQSYQFVSFSRRKCFTPCESTILKLEKIDKPNVEDYQNFFVNFYNQWRALLGYEEKMFTHLLKKSEMHLLEKKKAEEALRNTRAKM